MSCVHGMEYCATCHGAAVVHDDTYTRILQKQAMTINNGPPAGAKTDREPFDLVQIPLEAERRLGAIFKEGEQKYGRGNWRSGVGDKGYQLERANHAIKHLKIYLHWLEFGEYLGDPGEEGMDLAKVMWFCSTQMELERLERVQRGTTSVGSTVAPKD